MDELFVEGRKFLGIAGGKNSGKTETLACIAVALFLIDPKNTKCFMTAKTKQIAQGRNWGRVKLFWDAAICYLGSLYAQKGQDVRAIGEQLIPGVLKEGIIEYRDGKFRDSTSGIELVASEQGQQKKAAEKLQGAKKLNGTLFVDAEELAMLPHGLVETCRDNLAVNEGFKFAGPFNPIHYFDGAMLVAQPKNGWESITVDDDGWETSLGYCIHFDNLKSPNVLAGQDIWKGLYGKENLLWDEKTNNGQNTPGFWQQVRGFWSPMGAEAAIYSGQEIMLYHADRHVKNGWWWVETPKKLAGLDPAFVGGGDRAVVYFAHLGLAQFEDGSRRTVLEFIEYKILAGDVTKGHDKPRQVAESFKTECESRGVPINNTGVDLTGAASFGSLLRTIWGDGFLSVDFSESASDAQISETDEEVAREGYINKRAELWYSGKPLIRSQQLKGIDPDLASEICSCTFKSVNGKIAVEKKEDMKKRTGRSPDVAEGAWVTLQVAREVFGLVSTEKVRKANGNTEADDAYGKWLDALRATRAPDLEFQAA